MPRIMCAAVQYQLKGESLIRYMRGANHADCVKQFEWQGIKTSDRCNEKQGFLTNAFEFVDRQEAYTIAEEAGQLVSKRDDKTLFSENINYYGRLSHSSV